MKNIAGLLLSIFIFNSCAIYESDAYQILKDKAFTLSGQSGFVEFKCNSLKLTELNKLKTNSFENFVDSKFSPIKSFSTSSNHNEDFYVYLNNQDSAYLCSTSAENLLGMNEDIIFSKFKSHTKEAQ